MSHEQIDGDEVLLGGAKCVKNFSTFLPPFIKKLSDNMFKQSRPHVLEYGDKHTPIKNIR